MVHSLVTSFLFVSLIAFASCSLNQETFSDSEVDKLSAVFLHANALDLNAKEFTGSSLQSVDIPMQDATSLIEPVTLLSTSTDLLTTIPEGSLPGYLFQLFYGDKECKGPDVSGFSVKLNICSPNNEGYFFVTTTLAETIVTYYSDSSCTIVSSVEIIAFQECNMGFRNYVGPSLALPSKEPHVAIR
jgi:hypothetical protein